MSRKRKFEWVYNGKFHEQVPIQDDDMGKRKRKKDKTRVGSGYNIANNIPFDFEEAREINELREMMGMETLPEPGPTPRPNINIRRNDVMKALENMLSFYSPKSQRQLRDEFEEALDEVVSGFHGEQAINSLARRAIKNATNQRTT